MLLLLDDKGELSAFPDEEEQSLATELGAEGLHKIDEAIIGSARPNWLKVARVVSDAIKVGRFPYSDAAVTLHIRRVIELANSGALEFQGNLRRPRFSEVRIPNVNR